MLTLSGNSLEFSFPDLHEDAVLRISFQRTLRLPDDNREYPLPPSLGDFPLLHVDDYATRVPPAWQQHGGVFLPMHQAEALWISFNNVSRYEFAVKIAAGKINAVSGKPWTNELDFDDQDYVVVPGQPWLDGFCVGAGKVRQFVAMPLGQGYTAEEQLTGAAEHGGLQLLVYPLRPESYVRYEASGLVVKSCAACYDVMPSTPAMGLAPGGLMSQDIYEDERDPTDWCLETKARCFVHLLNSAQYEAVTGSAPPTMPPTAENYTAAGLPWFEYYRDAPRVEGGSPLKKLDSVAALGIKKGQQPLPDNKPVSPKHVKVIGAPNRAVRQGEF